mgnify:FL=1|jgi:hypothetical protein
MSFSDQMRQHAKDMNLLIDTWRPHLPDHTVTELRLSILGIHGTLNDLERLKASHPIDKPYFDRKMAAAGDSN